MAKIDVVLAIVQAAMTYSNDPAVNALYARMASNRDQLQGVCQNQDQTADILARDAVLAAVNQQGDPHWMLQAGI